MDPWTPSSWASKPIKQDVPYSDTKGVQAALDKLQKLPPLVTTQEITNLKKNLKNVALGKAFVLQGGTDSSNHWFYEFQSLTHEQEIVRSCLTTVIKT